jgi:hypothetical protein
LLVFANFDSYLPASRVFAVNALDHLSKSPLVQNLEDLVSVAQVFSNHGHILAFFVDDGVLVLPPHLAYSVDSFIQGQFDLLKFR